MEEVHSLVAGNAKSGAEKEQELLLEIEQLKEQMSILRVHNIMNFKKYLICLSNEFFV